MGKIQTADEHNNNISLVNIQASNTTIFMYMLSKFDDDLHKIKDKLDQTSINPKVICSIIDALKQINDCSGWGKVEIEVREYKITKCKGITDKLLELNIVV
jgi:hypothetical protein